VDRSATTDHEHPFVAEGSRRITEREVPGRVDVTLDRELDDRDPGFRVHQHQGYPGAVIQPPPGITVAGESCCLNEAGDPVGEFR
jgi:hypothetical protein